MDRSISRPRYGGTRSGEQLILLTVLVSASIDFLVPRFLGSQAVTSNRTVALSGRIMDAEGKPIPYAHLFEASTGAATVASRLGEFAFVSLDPGDNAILTVRRIGYRPLDTSFVRVAGLPIRVDLILQPITAKLDVVTVRASASDYDEYLDRSGYYRRSVHGVDGTFISARQIERRHPTELTAVLRDVPGIRVVSRGGRGGKNSYVLGRGGICALGLVVDGQRIETNAPPRETFQPRITSILGGRPVRATHYKPGDASIDELVPPSMPAAIEIYPSAASVPNPLSHLAEDCGLVVVWTRYQR